MIRHTTEAPPLAAPDSPAALLADFLGGEVYGPNSIRVGDRFVTVGVTGVVRCGPVRLGHISDGTEALGSAFELATVGGWA